MNQSKRIDPLLKRAQEHEDAVARDADDAGGARSPIRGHCVHTDDR